MNFHPRLAFLLLAGTALLTLTASPSSRAQPQQEEGRQQQQERREDRQQQRRERGQQGPAVQQPSPAPQSPGQERREVPQQGERQRPQAPIAQPQTPGSAPESREQRRDEPQRERRQDQANEPTDQRQQGPAGAQRERPQPAPSPVQRAPSPSDTPPAAQERRDQRRDGQRERRQDRANEPADQRQQAPAATQQQLPQPAPSPVQRAPSATPPAAQDRREQRREEPQQGGATDRQPNQQAPAGQQPPLQAPAARQAPATLAPPTQPRDARDFIRRDGQGPARKIDEVRQERQQTQEGNRTIIREGDRTIVREGDRTFIRHNETNRLTINARDVRTERRGANFETIVHRPGGYSIVTVTDTDGRLIRRVRRDQRGREIVIIDNRISGPRATTTFVQLPAPVIRIPRERYIVETWRAPREAIYDVFSAQPVEPLTQRYSLEQVRFSAPLRDRMPRVDLDITFDSGSWQLTPEQVDKLAVIAEGINRAVERNPSEVFMVEGYTDATGNDEDNLSLSDRRAESVAVALAEQFNVPPENLVTQGYGEQYLKVDTQGPEQLNRRVSVRRVTPLIDRQVSGPPPRR